MATTEASSLPPEFETTCYETALCIIPPLDYCREVDKLRELYDKGYGRWPAHINLLYPFVAIDHLPRAKELLQAKLGNLDELQVRLDGAGSFGNRHGHTVFACEDGSHAEDALDQLRNAVVDALDLPHTPCKFHLTLGQSADQSNSSRDFLLDKASRLPPCKFGVGSVAILMRERNVEGEKSSDHMKLWDTIRLPGSSPTTKPQPTEFWLESISKTTSEEEDQRMVLETGELSEVTGLAQRPERAETTYSFNPDSGDWEALSQDALYKGDYVPKTLTVSSYNVFVDSEYPPSGDRDSSLVGVLTSGNAVADVLILEEVSDQFLTYLLSHEDIQEHYSFTSYGPSTQPEIGPLPSLRNIVILSRFAFSWSYLPFQRRHKGATVVKFTDIGVTKGSNFHPLILAGIHLTSGLTDGAVAAKKIQICSLLNYLKCKHAGSPWILAGDFNVTTSTSTIDLALKDKSITQETATVLASIEVDIQEAGLIDCWSVARVQANDDQGSRYTESEDLFEGEEGATFNPRENAFAAESSGTSQNRPQRYDRILVRGDNLLQTTQFNMFGYDSKQDSADETSALSYPVPSDHYGVRASMRISQGDETVAEEPGLSELPELEIKHLPADLSTSDTLKTTLAKHHMFPSEDEVSERKAAFTFLKDVLSGEFDPQGSTQSHLLLAIVPVGSFALNVWTASSDIDCLCIGNISSKTFFKLARQRIRKAADRGIRIFRKVEAKSGTLLELSVRGIHADLHYCPATRVVERWSTLPQLPHTDPSFDLPVLSLRKLKPYRDLDYIQRTLSDTAVFRLAYRCIKLWASQNGLYSARFGYLGGIHITLMLSLICKRIAHQAGSVTAEDVVATFFHYYANFDWKNEMVYDPFFHKERPRYHRTAREPMVILGLHVPNANVAHTSTAPGLQVLMKEIKAAEQRLSEPSLAWEDFFNSPNSSVGVPGHTYEFLHAFDNYVRIDIQFWGRSQSKGRGLFGWLESRCLLLVVDIQRVLPSLEVRIWPARFASPDASSERDYQGCYLIGLSRSPDTEAGSTKPDRQAAKDALLTILKRFEQQMQSDDRYYDPDSSWIGVDLVKRSDLGLLRLDERTWGDAGEEEADGDSEEEEEQDPADADESSETAQSLSLYAGRHAKVAGKKLRPASDILNRLRWDSGLDIDDYIVGYLDRFIGVMESSLERWKTEQTDEEFIPQHRIMYFKRKSDGVMMWERQSRIDRIFGSGVGSGE